MLDWQDVTAQIQHVETLSVEDLRVQLDELRAASPELGDEVTQYFTRKSRLNSFMQISALMRPFDLSP